MSAFSQKRTFAVNLWRPLAQRNDFGSEPSPASLADIHRSYNLVKRGAEFESIYIENIQ